MSTAPSTRPIDVSVTRLVEAPAEFVYDLVSDITRMPEWSPETIETAWLDGATSPAVGARFSGKNRLGKNTWSTKPMVTAAEPGRRFAFEVPGKSGATWCFEFNQVGQQTEVTESVLQTKRSPALIRFLQRRAGVTDRAANLRQNMTTTLDRLAAVAEQRSHLSPARNNTGATPWNT